MNQLRSFSFYHMFFIPPPPPPPGKAGGGGGEQCVDRLSCIASLSLGPSTSAMNTVILTGDTKKPQSNLLKNITQTHYMYSVGLPAEFRSEKIPRNRLGTASVIPRKKVLI
jgi:hypothetical protein